jgi:precorrin-3B synthase
MATGDGLLARLTPAGSTISLDAFAGLCAAARTHGNGIVEITSRGSIQIRGLSAASAPLFAAEVASLGIEASDGFPVVTDPLAGLTDDDVFDTHALAAPLREALAVAPFVSRLSAKVSLAIDGGAALHLDTLTADVRMRAVDDRHLYVSLAGDAATATPLGAVPLERAVECIVRLFETLATTAPRSRMREAIQGAGLNIQIRGCRPPRRYTASSRRPADPSAFPLSSGNNAWASACRSGIRIGNAVALIARPVRPAPGLRTTPAARCCWWGCRRGARQVVAEAKARLHHRSRRPASKIVAVPARRSARSGEIATRAIARRSHARGRCPMENHPYFGMCQRLRPSSPSPLAVFGRDGSLRRVRRWRLSCSVTADALPGGLATRSIARRLR